MMTTTTNAKTGTILPGEITVTVPAGMCYLGWQESLVQLANLVEPDIKDE